ncbi:hypothetical protein QW060_17445 [Myroides ceti]|uniref:Uncharacterized protein n=1 Tax=Paenimyroides ceti TaxID=395087 RepID=A0ABT8CZ03_9FLAO|nr:hypothetical protein [Paenimyroides ceti]MDN3705636.1 hypothetical protein [Paenimyroides ceti]MDN3708878.1 hypothetical protein [Paenimyroides ceti]
MESKQNKEDKNTMSSQNKELVTKLWIIFKFICGCFILVLLSYKIFTNDISIAIGNIDYTILLSFLLAFFSIVLSMMFYFKSNDSSNQFYDNTYKFTKDISTILGRIEAGFGEKLQNLDKGYEGLLNKIDKSPTVAKDIEETKTDKKEVEQTLHSEIKERNKIIQDLLEKSQLENQEKEDIKKSLFMKESTILKLERELRILQSKLERQKNDVLSESIPDRLTSFLKRYIMRLAIDLEQFNREQAQEIIDSFLPTNEKDKIGTPLYQDLLEYTLIRENGKLTNKGYSIIRNLVRENK